MSLNLFLRIWRWVFDFLFNFSKETSFFGKAARIFALLYLEVVWTGFMMIFLRSALGLETLKVSAAIYSSLTIDVAEKIFRPNTRYRFFLICVLAPLWEECVFRYFPIRFAQLCDEGYRFIKTTYQSWMLAPIVLAGSLIFGILHGSSLNILFQGVGGLFLCWLYLRNRNSYWSAVIYHGLWNFLVVFLRIF